MARPSRGARKRPRVRRLTVEAGAESVERVILRRGSSRQFQLAPIDADALRTMLAAAMRPVPGDWPSLDGEPVNGLYVIVNNVDGLAPGGYVYHAEGGELEMLHSGDHRFMAGHLGLNQALAHDAAVNYYFLTDLDAVTAAPWALGATGRRSSDASIRAGRLYLSAYSMGLGATGLTFFERRGDAVLFAPRGGQEHHVPDAGWCAAEAAAGHALSKPPTLCGDVREANKVSSADRRPKR